MDDEQHYRAAVSKDARFDGVFFIAVTSTGIYCRPSCPAMTPKREHMRFYKTPASAQQAGFRACKRCRPDASPGSPEWNIRADMTARAMRLIADGIVDREGIDGLARSLGYEQRQVRRVLTAELGASPLALARAQRAQTARVLVETT
ncbi:MAG TPA: Ada metal-binding domain-containing protein, partial [Trebonia sp.]|nr:Ada metal-binding domain-containing protein [Trebonia sp.]